MIAALLAELWPYIAGLLGIIAGSLGLYAKGRSDAKAKAETATLKDYQAKRQEVDNADVSVGDSDADLEWLRSRSKQ